MVITMELGKSDAISIDLQFITKTNEIRSHTLGIHEDGLGNMAQVRIDAIKVAEIDLRN